MQKLKIKKSITSIIPKYNFYFAFGALIKNNRVAKINKKTKLNSVTVYRKNLKKPVNQTNDDVLRSLKKKDIDVLNSPIKSKKFKFDLIATSFVKIAQNKEKAKNRQLINNYIVKNCQKFILSGGFGKKPKGGVVALDTAQLYRALNTKLLKKSTTT